MTNELINNLKSIIYQEMHESRGSWSTKEYCDLILNIILIVYLSNKFHDFYLELINEDEEFAEEPNIYYDFDVIYLPPQSRWDNIMKNIEFDDIKETFNQTINYLKHYDSLINDIVCPFAFFEINTFGLKRFLYIFDDFISNNNFENEIWIKIYKSFLSDFAILYNEYELLTEKIDKII